MQTPVENLGCEADNHTVTKLILPWPYYAHVTIVPFAANNSLVPGATLAATTEIHINGPCLFQQHRAANDDN